MTIQKPTNANRYPVKTALKRRMKLRFHSLASTLRWPVQPLAA
ncbi:hypothetical protein [Spirosoma pollinicola]|nr:hypothetical protein [Spirosoma pollinicola]